MIYYYPSCKFTAAHPELSEKIGSFLKERGIETAGCCRKTHGLPAAGDGALTVCQSCRMIVSENRPDCEVRSLFEYLDALPEGELPLPDLRGERITVQDCYRAKDRESEKAAVRSLLRKMNAEIVELPGLPEELMYDGDFLWKPLSAENRALAPKGFAEFDADMTPLPPDDRNLSLASAVCRT